MSWDNEIVSNGMPTDDFDDSWLHRNNLFEKTEIVV